MDEILNELFGYLKVGLPVAWGVLIRQVYIVAFQQVFYSLALITGAIFCINRFRASWEDWDDEDVVKASFFFVAVVLIVIAFGLIVGAVSRFINPQYYVLEWLRNGGQW